MQPNKTPLSRPSILVLLASVILFVLAVVRDYGYAQMYQPDLRNRVVGARLVEDGKLPYFYKWHTGGPDRYYDPFNAWVTNVPDDYVQAAAMTASPFFHQMMIPIADLPESVINLLWPAMEYLAVLLMTFLTFKSTTNKTSRLMTLCVTALYFGTAGWADHIVAGQMYIFIVCITMIIFFLLHRSADSYYTIIPAAIGAIVIILMKPIAALLLAPFILDFKRFKKFIFCCFIFAGAYAAYVFSSPFQVALYKDYRKGVEAHVIFHQTDTMDFFAKEPGPTIMEGIDLHKDSILTEKAYFRPDKESSNFFEVVNRLFKTHIAVNTMYICYGVVFLTVMFFLYRRQRKMPLQISELFMGGYLLYTLMEIFMPVHRLQYYSAQMILGLLLFCLPPVKKPPVCYILVVTGLLLNIITWHILTMKNMTGEVLIMSGIFLSIILSKEQYNKWQSQSSLAQGPQA